MTAWNTADNTRIPLVIVPIEQRTARAFIAWTREEPLPRHDATFAIGANTGDGVLVGVVIAGHPVDEALDDGHTVEITRLATDGTPNACSALISATWRLSRAMGYRRFITTCADEAGTILRTAAGDCMRRTGRAAISDAPGTGRAR